MFKQFIRFGLIGALNTSLDFVIYIVLTRFFLDNYLVANFISFSLATINSYFFNKYWTFRDKSKQHQNQYPKFYLVSLIGLLINESILYTLVQLGLYDLLAKVAAVGLVLFWNFFANKYWTFKKSENLL